MALLMEIFVRETMASSQENAPSAITHDDTTLFLDLAAYYQEAGNWDDVSSYFEQQGIMNANVAISDNAFNVQYGASGAQTILETQWTVIHPISVNGERVGNLHILSQPSPPTSGLLRYILPFGAFVCSIFGILAGVLVSHTLTTPLGNLADAATLLGQQRRLDERIVVNGTREVVELAQSFNDMAASLQKAEYLRQQLVTDVAHELRTPLNSLQGNLYAMLDDMYPLTKEEIVKLYERTRGLIRLVEDLSEVSRAESGQLTMHMAQVDLHQMIENVVGAILSLSNKEDILIDLVLPNDSINVMGDSERLAQVLRNVLSNSFNHIKSGRIEITAMQHNNEAFINISDTGSGIPEEHLPFIFERFYRADASRDRIHGGTGIGLSISRAIVHAHQGTISAQSPGLLGRGTTIRIVLPAGT